MSDDNEIEPAGQSDGDGEEGDEAGDIAKEMFFHLDRSEPQDGAAVGLAVLKVFAAAYGALLLAAVTLRIFERREPRSWWRR